MICRSKIGEDTYEIYKESQNKETSEYLVVISNNKKVAVCDIVGNIFLEDVLALTNVKVSIEKEPIVIDSLNIEN